MREMFKSKGIVIFIIMVLGVTYASSLKSDKLEDENLQEYRDIVVMNAK